MWTTGKNLLSSEQLPKSFYMSLGKSTHSVVEIDSLRGLERYFGVHVHIYGLNCLEINLRAGSPDVDSYWYQIEYNLLPNGDLHNDI